ncbi:MAG: FprA family A-type flavoprotein [Chloroflexi bacterium]|nr:FprA family A-type flavoprotein [Chloroflexota bacterium]
MKPIAMRPGIYWVGAVDWDRRLFDALIPLPDGTSYNAYLVKGSEKTALLDTVEPSMQHQLLAHLEHLQIGCIDYVVSHHAEQDHTGCIPTVLEKYPLAKVVCTPRAKGMLNDLVRVTEDRIVTVNDKETISLGDRTLEFIHAPWVHWPETMFSYLKEERVLFTCDLFGSHLAASDLYVKDEGQAYEAAKRYYAEIMMPFRSNIHTHLERLKGYPIDIIATSHGPAYDKPDFILKAYHNWVFDPPRNIVVLPYVTMHGSTRLMVEHFVSALAERGVTVQQFDLVATDIGKLAISLVDAATIVIGTPTFLVGPHPAIASAAALANLVRPKVKFLSVIGSYGWGSKAVEQLTGMLSNIKAEVLPPVIVRGLPREADYKALDNLADTIAHKHKENGFT